MKRNIISAFAVGLIALTASAQYKVVVTTNEGEKFEYPTSGVESIRFEEAPVYTPLSVFIDAEYTSKGENGIYSFTLATEQPDSEGNPSQIGGVQISMSLTSDLSENYLDAVLPAGYYRAGTGANKGEFNVQNSGIWIRLDEGEDGVLLNPIVDGTVDVSHDGDSYDIKFELTLLQGGSIALSYSGKMDFTPGASEYENFTTDQNIQFTGAQERYFANWFYPFCDDATLELYTGSFTAQGQQTEGYWLSLPIFMPKVDDPKNPATYLADGVYSIDTREKVFDNTELPFTITKGGTVDFWGTIFPVGAYATYIDKSGRIMRGFIEDGTMKVSNNGTRFDIDFTTDNGIKITGTYEGSVYVENRNDSEKAPAIEGTIDKDIVFDFIPGTIGMSYPLGDYIKTGIYQFQVMIADPDMLHGDFLMMELSSDKEVLPDGTYTFNNEIAPFDGIKGYLDYGGNTMFSWYGNLDDVDEKGVQNLVAPVMGGTVTISTTATNTRKLVFNLLDEDGHSMTGTFEGIFYDFPSDSYSPERKSPFKLGSSDYVKPATVFPTDHVRIAR
ncbi:MAG: hypothetical protein NC095_09040 [Muribaculum sp.]|nr:hypothetical protein [Muribaculum sp.]